MKQRTTLCAFACCVFALNGVYAQKKRSNKQIEKLKTEVATIVEENKKQSQVMVDKIFSFSELGFQEVSNRNFSRKRIRD